MFLRKDKALASARLFIFSVLATTASNAIAGSYPYLNDANQDPLPPQAEIEGHSYPRTMNLGVRDFAIEQYGKYHVIVAKGMSMQEIADLQALYPDVTYIRHYSPRAYQGYVANNCTTAQGMAFQETGPVTQGGPPSAGCAMYAGHWLYKAGTKLRQSINATTKTLPVTDAKKVAVGQYVVIYNPPAGSFINAEHAKVTGRNLSTNTITLESRGFKSTAQPHPSGSIVAQHVLGQGTDPRLWSYNLSTQSPRDANNRTAGEALSWWLSRNLDKDRFGRSVNGLTVAGVEFDADFYFDAGSNDSDANNDLVADDSISPTGVNWWGKGLDDFYADLRARMPNKLIIAGSRTSRGHGSLNGIQMEHWISSGAAFVADPVYGNLDGMFSDYLFNTRNYQNNPIQVHNLSKIPTLIYPGNARPAPTSNASFRFGLAMTLLDDGYYGSHGKIAADAWYDEYAVDVTPGSSNYGRAIRRSNTNAARTHRGWLGQPLGPFERIYDDLAFAESQSMVGNGNFDSNLVSWSGRNVNISRNATNALDGAAAMGVSKHSTYKRFVTSASVDGPSVGLTQGVEYTLAFAARAPTIRSIRASVGPQGQTFLVGPKWRRYVMTFSANASRNEKIRFYVGRENTTLMFDSVYFFQGNANIFRRDFENGIVIANGTPGPKTVPLADVFQHIEGTQDSINNGNQVTKVNLGAYDAVLLVRLDGDQEQSSSNSGDNSGDPSVCWKLENYDPSTLQGLSVWKNCNSHIWRVRATAGGSASGIRYSGNVTTNRVMVGADEYQLEQSDSFALVNDGKRIDFDLRVVGNGEDGFRFEIPGSATSACLQLDVGGPIYLGAASSEFSQDVNLLEPGTSCP